MKNEASNLLEFNSQMSNWSEKLSLALVPPL